MSGADPTNLRQLHTPVAKLAVSVLAAIVIWFGVNAGEEDPFDRDVCIVLWNASIEGIPLSVNADYFGPSRLDLVRANLKGGRQKRLALQVAYPSMEPWRDRQNEAIAGEMNLFVMITPTIGGSVAHVFEGQPDGLVGWIKGYAATSTKLHQMDHYGELGKSNEEAFYAKYEDPTRNVLITCPVRAPASHNCRVRIETRNFLALVFQIPKTELPQWRQFVAAVRSFATSLVVTKESEKCPD